MELSDMFKEAGKKLYKRIIQFILINNMINVLYFIISED